MTAQPREGTRPAAARYNSAARIAAVTICMPVPATMLSPLLARRGLVALPVHGATDGLHPVCIELWTVTEGRAELGGVSQHDWASRAAGLTGAALGVWWGAAMGGARGLMSGVAGAQNDRVGGPWWRATLGSVLGAATGALEAGTTMASSLGQAGRSASRWAARNVGSYHEVLIAVPHVIGPRGQRTPRRFVLGMYTDNPVAIWGDLALGTGYRKQLASISTDGARQYTVSCPAGSVLEASLTASPGRAGPRRRTRQPTTIDAIWDQPLLGVRRDGQLVESVLERAAGGSGDQPARLTADLAIASGFAAGVPAGRRRVGPLTARSPFGSCRTTAADVRLTYPVPV